MKIVHGPTGGRITLALSLIAAAVSGCRGESAEQDQRVRGEALDTAAIATSQAPHPGHAMPDTASADSHTLHRTGEMDDAPAAGTGPAGQAGHAGMAGMTHTAAAAGSEASAPSANGGHAGMRGMPQTAAVGGAAGSGGAASTGAMEHAGHPVAASGRGAAAAGAGAEHSEHAVASSGQPGRAASPAHSEMAHSGDARSAERGGVTDHSAHQQASPALEAHPINRSARAAQAVADPHAAHAAAAGETAGGPEAAAGMDRLLTLVAELVRDSVVRRQIEEDPLLRELWRDPGVRQTVLRGRD